MQAALEAATFGWEDAQAGAKQTGMPAPSSLDWGGVQRPLLQPERIHCEGLTPSLTARLPATMWMQRDFNKETSFHAQAGFWTLHENRIMFKMQKESNATLLYVFVKWESQVHWKALIFMKLRQDLV